MDIYILFDWDGWNESDRLIGAFSSLHGAKFYIPKVQWKLEYPAERPYRNESWKGWIYHRNGNVNRVLRIECCILRD